VEGLFCFSPAPPKRAIPILVILLAEPLFRPRIRITKSASKGWGPLFFMPTLEGFSTLEGDKSDKLTP
jgi:hypothetical protein